MTTFAPPSSFVSSSRPTNGVLLQSPPRRRVTITNRYGNQRRPLPIPVSSPSPTASKKKSVRFCPDNDLEHVRLFLKTQSPLSAAHDPKRWEIKYPGWPSKWAMYKSLANSPIKMEQVMLSNDNDDDQGMFFLKGRCRVANLAYEKQVIVRYSFDQWETSREQLAMYREPIITATTTTTTTEWDRFTFEIPVPIVDAKDILTCSMALRYQVNDQLFWDNNDGQNYQVQLTALSVPPVIDDDDDKNKDYFSLPLKPPSLSSVLHTGYDNFISKYCFYNPSIVQH